MGEGYHLCKHPLPQIQPQLRPDPGRQQANQYGRSRHHHGIDQHHPSGCVQIISLNFSQIHPQPLIFLLDEQQGSLCDKCLPAVPQLLQNLLTQSKYMGIGQLHTLYGSDSSSGLGRIKAACLRSIRRLKRPRF